MRLFLIALFAMVASCGSKSEAPPKDAFEAFERRFVREGQWIDERARKKGMPTSPPVKSYRAVYVGPDGVYMDRKRVATLDELGTKRDAMRAALDENVKVVRADGIHPTVTWDLDDEPAAAAISALRMLADRQDASGEPELWHLRTVIDSENPSRATEPFGGPRSVSTRPSADKQKPTLSILMLPGAMWVGMSVANEFYEIPDRPEGRDFVTIENVLKTHKGTEAFMERWDLELAVTAGTAADVLTVVEIATKVGFIDLTVLPREQLSANPSL